MNVIYTRDSKRRRRGNELPKLCNADNSFYVISINKLFH